MVRADELLREGRTDDARTVLVRHLTTPGHDSRWRPGETLTLRDLEALVALVPRPFPTGNPVAEAELVSILVRLGEYDQAARFGAESFTRMPSAVVAVEGRPVPAAPRGDTDLAVRWLRAGSVSSGPHLVVRVIDEAPEFQPLRWRHDVQTVRAEAAGLGAAG